MTNYLFDFAGTIATLSPSPVQLYASIIKDYNNVDISTQEISRALMSADASMPYSSVNITSKLEREAYYIEFNNLTLTLLGLRHVTSPEAIYDLFTSVKRHWVFRPCADQLLKRLYDANHTVSIISNFDSYLPQLINRITNVSHLLSFIYVSASVGLEKPSPEFYLNFLSESQFSADSCVYVGDSYSLDYLPATEIGIRTFLLDESHLFLNRSINRIDSLEQIITIDSIR